MQTQSIGPLMKDALRRSGKPYRIGRCACGTLYAFVDSRITTNGHALTPCCAAPLKRTTWGKAYKADVLVRKSIQDDALKLAT